MDIREVDTSDEELLQALWRIGWDSQGEDRPWHGFGPWPTTRVNWQRRGKNYRRHLFAAYDGERPVGLGELALPLRDNPHLCEVRVIVASESRRQGHGGALLDTMFAEAREAGRTSAWTFVTVPLDTPGDGLPWALAHGFAECLRDEVKVADLHETAPLWPVLVAETEKAASGYELVTWTQRCPDHLVATYCVLSERFLALAPMGGLDVEPETWDETRLRDREQAAAEGGRQEWTTMALAPNGTGVGFTEMIANRARPELASQGATVVLPEHRGHALGIRLKAVNQLAFTAAHPDARHVVTGNAEVNTHMNAINDRLGFHTVERSAELQRPI